MNFSKGSRALVAGGATVAVVLSASVSWAAPPGGGEADPGSLYSDLVVALRAADGTPILKEYEVTDETGTSLEYCVQPASYVAVPGITPIANPLDGRQVWVIPLQGEWIENPVDPLPVEEIEACDPKPQYAMFVTETELERLNLTRTSDTVIARKIKDVEAKLISADVVGLDPAGRLTADGLALDAAPEYAGMYQSLMNTGTIPGLDFADIPYNEWQMAAVAIGAAASKGVPITVDTVQYYNRIVGFTMSDPLPSWGDLEFINSQDPDPVTPMPVDVLPGGEDFVDYSAFTYNRSETFIGSVTWLDVAALKWNVSRILDTVPWTNLTAGQTNSTPLTGVTAFAQMADDARAVINYLHEHDQILPGFYMDPVLVDTTQAQLDAITLPAVQLTAPAQVFETLPFQMTAALFNPWGGALVDDARVRVTVDAPDALAATDLTVSSGGADVPFTVNGDGDLVGWVGDAEGFEMAPGYNVSSDFDAVVAGSAPTGTFAVTFAVVDVDDPTTVLADDTALISVNANETTVLWGAEIPVLATQGSYVIVPVRAYAPSAQDAVLTFTLTGPGDDPTTDVLEELAAGDAKVYGDNGSDMVAMPLDLSAQDVLTGTWPAALNAGYNEIVWYLLVAEGAPVGQYGIDVGIQSGNDIAEAQYVSFAAPETHGEEPPDVGEDTTAPVVMITIDALTADSASFSFTSSEVGVTFQCQLSIDGVKGAWEECNSGTKTYSGLEPASYVFYVKGTDPAGNAATYIKKFVIAAPVAPETVITDGPADLSWLLAKNATFTLDSDIDGVSYQVVVNGEALPDCTTSTCKVTGLVSGTNRIKFAAATPTMVDETPEVRTVFVPFGFKDTTRSAGWEIRHDEDSLFDTYGFTKQRDEYAQYYGATVKRIAIVVTTAPESGKVHVYLGSKRLTKKAISLTSSTVVNRVLIPVKTFAEAREGRVRVVVASTGAPVRLEGIGIATR